jgi:hypothetical protein
MKYNLIKLAVGICSTVLHPLDSLDGQSSHLPHREKKNLEMWEEGSYCRSIS